MLNHTKLEDKLEGAHNFQSWKYRISLILEDNDLDKYVTEEVPEPDGDDAKATYKNMIRAKRIIAHSIKDHHIPHVSSLRTLKRMFDALIKLFEGKNIN